MAHPFQAATGTGSLSSFYKGDIPRLRGLAVHLHAIVCHMKRDIGGVQEVVGKIFLDDVALITQANDEIEDAVLRIHLENVPENGASPNFHHGLGAHRGFFTDTSSQPARQNNRLHFYPTLRRPWPYIPVLS